MELLFAFATYSRFEFESSQRPMGPFKVVLDPEIVRSGATFPFKALTLSNTKMELLPALATNSRFETESSQRPFGEIRVVLDPEIARSGTTFPLTVLGLLNTKMEFVPVSVA
jgi:hypothetical protein